MRGLAAFSLMCALFAASSCTRETLGNDAGTSDQNVTTEGPRPDVPGSKCPAGKPQEGSACSDATLTSCDYLIQVCPCGPSDLMWHCDCRNGAWACTRDYDCYPCDGGPRPVDLSPCPPPPPPCNWCGGAYVYDTYGCIIGYQCANGADPCVTQPCSSTGCPPGQVCGSDQLCWSAGDSGVPVTCVGGMCAGSSAGDCQCEWTCSNGNKYGATCTPDPSGSMSCQCLVNSSTVGSCSLSGGMSSCGMTPMAQCCGFPP